MLHLKRKIWLELIWTQSKLRIFKKKKEFSLQNNPKILDQIYTWVKGEQSGSVVECLTQDRGVAGSSLTGGAALGP